MEAIARAVEGEFKAYLPRLLQQILQTFDGDLSRAALETNRTRLNTLLHVLRAFVVFGSSLEDYLQLILPVIKRSIEDPLAPEELRRTALRTIGQLAAHVNFGDYAIQIIHPMIRAMATGDKELRSTAMDTLCALAVQFGAEFAIFIPMVNKVSILKPGSSSAEFTGDARIPHYAREVRRNHHEAAEPRKVAYGVGLCR